MARQWVTLGWAAAVAALGGLVAGCGGPSAAPEDPDRAGAPDPSERAAVRQAPVAGPGTSLGTTLDVAAFQGGYGIDFYEAAAKEFGAKHPDLKITLKGNPRIWEQLRPRLVGGTPPDLMFPGWGMDHWALVEEGQLLALDDALAAPADGNSGTSWRDTFEPALLKLGESDGHQWMLPYYFNVMGWWYDPGVFARRGWTPPRTYQELLTLAPKIVAAGMAPITFQGKYPYYMIEGMLLPWAHSVGGAEAVRDAQNLVPGAWKSPAMLRAAEMIRELDEKGFFQKGAVAMSHTEAQQEFLQGRAAMVPCGTWLASEMRDVKPPNARMEYFLPPVVDGAKGDPSAVIISVEPWMFPAQAKNPAGAVALFRHMTSLPVAKQFVKEKATLMAIKGSDEGDLPAELRGPARVFRESKTVYATPYRQWYPAFQTELENALTALLNRELTPQQFVERAEAAAEAVRKDDSVRKHQVQ